MKLNLIKVMLFCFFVGLGQEVLGATSADVATALGNYCVQSEASCAKGDNVTYNSSGNCTCTNNTNLTWDSSTRKCACGPGIYVSGNSCIPCSDFYYSSAFDSARCTFCDGLTDSAKTKCVAPGSLSYTTTGRVTLDPTSDSYGRSGTQTLPAGCYRFSLVGGGGLGGFSGNIVAVFVGHGGGSGHLSQYYRCYTSPVTFNFTLGDGGVVINLSYCLDYCYGTNATSTTLTYKSGGGIMTSSSDMSASPGEYGNWSWGNPGAGRVSGGNASDTPLCHGGLGAGNPSGSSSVIHRSTGGDYATTSNIHHHWWYDTTYSQPTSGKLGGGGGGAYGCFWGYTYNYAPPGNGGAGYILIDKAVTP